MYQPQGGMFGFAPPPQRRNLLPQLPASPTPQGDLSTPAGPQQTMGQQFADLKRKLGLGPPPMPGAGLPGTGPITAPAMPSDAPIDSAGGAIGNAVSNIAGGGADAAAAGGEGAGIGDFLAALFGA